MTDNKTNLLPFPAQLIGNHPERMSDHQFLMAGKLRAAQFLNGVAAGRNHINEKTYEALKGMNQILMQQGYPPAIDPEELEQYKP